VVVVLDKSMESFWNQMAFDFHTPQHFCVFGGKERYHSVRNAINALEDQPAVVAIHDAARPNISCELINLLFQQASKNHSAIPFTIPVDTIRVKEGSETNLIDRSQVMLIQTPQCFLLSDLKDAYQQDYQESFTDDASVMERYLSEPLHFVEGEKLNFKITHPSDWEIMQKIFKP
jgi:2-C-methyl-D-erythritol 4-phosphate cytidylyltransferase